MLKKWFTDPGEIKLPTRRERRYYQLGFRDGMSFLERYPDASVRAIASAQEQLLEHPDTRRRTKKRKLSAWNKYVKNKRNHIKYRDGTLNLKKMAVAFRRKKRGRK